ncbi:MAG TPA: MFS transporter, partial [Enterovirga sp.]|nr:MFS transporter [Enterovirga sp.]
MTELATRSSGTGLPVGETATGSAAGAPTPLYVVSQQQWGFPTSTLTLVFAAYVLGLLATILVVGALSDHVGR